MTGLRIAGLTKSFGQVEILRGIDLQIAEGEFVCFLGPSGCGKSTLLRCIAGLEELNGGSIHLEGREITHLPSAQRDIAMVFQNYALYPHMTVRQNMAFGLSLNGVPKPDIAARVAEAADILRIGDLLDRKPRQLSGGQRQRVAIGRAIIRKPELFLLDEPLSNLDAGLRVTMRAELAALHDRLGATMIHVTHDQVEAMTLASRVVVLDKGGVSQFASPLGLFHRPANLFVAGFIGSPRMNFLPARLQAQTQASVTLAIAGMDRTLTVPTTGHALLDAARPLTLGIRPDRIELGEQGPDSLTGTVRLTERLGSESHLHIDLDAGGSVVAIAQGTHAARVHDRISLRIPAADAHVFDAGGLALPRRLDAATEALISETQ